MQFAKTRVSFDFDSMNKFFKLFENHHYKYYTQKPMPRSLFSTYFLFFLGLFSANIFSKRKKKKETERTFQPNLNCCSVFMLNTVKRYYLFNFPYPMNTPLRNWDFIWKFKRATQVSQKKKTFRNKKTTFFLLCSSLLRCVQLKW